jgi:hypothetical protein
MNAAPKNRHPVSLSLRVPASCASALPLSVPSPVNILIFVFGQRKNPILTFHTFSAIWEARTDQLELEDEFIHQGLRILAKSG